MGQANRLPDRFPDGTRYIIEGRDGHIVLRYLEFPDGRQVDLLAENAQAPRPRTLAQPGLRKRAAGNSRK